MQRHTNSNDHLFLTDIGIAATSFPPITTISDRSRGFRPAGPRLEKLPPLLAADNLIFTYGEVGDCGFEWHDFAIVTRTTRRSFHVRVQARRAFDLRRGRYLDRRELPWPWNNTEPRRSDLQPPYTWTLTFEELRRGLARIVVTAWCDAPAAQA